METRYSHQLAVRFADTDCQGHVFFANYLTYFDEGLTGYMRAIGLPWSQFTDSGYDMVYARAQLDYQGRAKFGDRLSVGTKIARIGNTSITTYFAIERPSDGDCICTGEVVSVCLDRASGVPIRVPDSLREAVASFEIQISS